MTPMSLKVLDQLDGWTTPDEYSTAWVAMVPCADDINRPAWPEALRFLRNSQMDDGGWGTKDVFYAHERTISTLCAIRAFSTWAINSEDRQRIEVGLKALHSYAHVLPSETHEPVGFELLLPRLVKEMNPLFTSELPLEQWRYLQERSQQKLAMIQRLQPDPYQPRSWWFSLEMLSEEQLSEIDETLLEPNGSIATSTAATAAYLRAQRLHRRDVPRAARYISNLVSIGQGSVPFSWPTEIFDCVWALDSLRRADFDPKTPGVMRVARTIRDAWDRDEPGLSSSTMFRVNDGDDTLVGFAILNWAGLSPSDDAILGFWDGDHFLSYKDERHASVSANIHGLIALRSQPGFPHRVLAERVSSWLIKQIRHDVFFDDKWHFSPYYSVAHAIGAFIGWRDAIARKGIKFLMEHQNADGGWGTDGKSTQEETAHCVLGLHEAFKHNLLQDLQPLSRAADFFYNRFGESPKERLWIGKTLFRPEAAIQATLLAAHTVLERFGYEIVEKSKKQTA